MRSSVDVEDSLIEEHDVLNERDLVLKTRLGDDALRPAEFEEQCLLGLADGKQREIGDERGDSENDQAKREGCAAHGWPSGAVVGFLVNSDSGRKGTTPGPALSTDHLLGVAKHLLHGLDEDTLAGDVGRLLVLLVNADEAVGLTLGQGNHLISIALRGLQDAFGLASRLGDDTVGIGLRLVLEALLVGACRLHVAEGVNDLRRRIYFLQLHLSYQYACTVAVEGLLHQSLRVSLGLGTRPGEDRLDIALADDLAHGAFRHVLHRALGVLDVEQEVCAHC